MPENLYCPGVIAIRFLLVFRDPAAVNLKAEAAFRCSHDKHLFFVAPARSRQPSVPGSAQLSRTFGVRPPTKLRYLAE